LQLGALAHVSEQDGATPIMHGLSGVEGHLVLALIFFGSGF
jgi:hypothetical protein